jgi:hypothetical protein
MLLCCHEIKLPNLKLRNQPHPTFMLPNIIYCKSTINSHKIELHIYVQDSGLVDTCSITWYYLCLIVSRRVGFKGRCTNDSWSHFNSQPHKIKTSKLFFTKNIVFTDFLCFRPNSENLDYAAVKCAKCFSSIYWDGRSGRVVKLLCTLSFILHWWL